MPETPDKESTNQEQNLQNQRAKPKRTRVKKTDATELELRTVFDRETLIIHCIAMKLTEAEALAYMRVHGHPIKRTQYYEDKKKIEESTFTKANQIANGGLLEQHMERIRSLETIEHEMWINYHKEKSPLRRVLILDKVKELQPYISAAYDYTKVLIAEQAKLQSIIQRTPQKQLVKVN